MEVIGVVLIILIIIVGVSRYSPDNVYSRAENLFNESNYSQASKLLNGILDKHNEAPLKLAQCKMRLGEQAKRESEKIMYFNEVLSLSKLKNKSFSSYKFDELESKAFFEIAKIQFEQSKENIDKINQNILYIDAAKKVGLGMDSEFSNLKRSHFSILAALLYKSAIDKEKLNDYHEAISDYNKARDLARGSNYPVWGNSNARSIICQLKLNQNIEVNNIPKPDWIDEKIRNELYYRLAIQLLRIKNIKDAEMIVSTYLNFQSPVIDRLKECLVAEKNNLAYNIVTQTNKLIEKLYSKKFSIEELKSFYLILDDRVNTLSYLDSELSKKLFSIKPTLFSRLLKQYILEEQYIESFEIISQYPEFWENLELLKGIGICCFGIVNQGNLNENNYQIIISSWLTAVYADKVILNSLKNTTWDDEYTFTLIDSIGSKFYSPKRLPKNVNHEEANEMNISIGETQKELLNQFEKLLHYSIIDTSMANSAQKLYIDEKEVVEKIVAKIPNINLSAGPKFAKQYNINKIILREIEKTYSDTSDENLLEIGCFYIQKQSDGKNELEIEYREDGTVFARSANCFLTNENISTLTGLVKIHPKDCLITEPNIIVCEYSTAKEIITKMISAIKKNDLAFMNSLNFLDYRLILAKFEKIKSLAEELSYKCFSTLIENDDENEELIPLFIIALNILPNSIRLKHLFSRFILNLCVAKINKETLDNYSGLHYLHTALLVSPTNKRIAENIATLIKLNILDVINDKIKHRQHIKNYVSIDFNLKTRFEYYNERSKNRFNNLFELPVDNSSFERDLKSLMGIPTKNSIDVKYGSVLFQIDEIYKMNNPLVKSACMELKVLKSSIIDKLGKKAYQSIEYGTSYTLNSHGLAIKESFRLMDNFSK
jgi:hypothetical protein